MRTIQGTLRNKYTIEVYQKISNFETRMAQDQMKILGYDFKNAFSKPKLATVAELYILYLQICKSRYLRVLFRSRKK